MILKTLTAQPDVLLSLCTVCIETQTFLIRSLIPSLDGISNRRDGIPSWARMEFHPWWWCNCNWLATVRDGSLTFPAKIHVRGTCQWCWAMLQTLAWTSEPRWEIVYLKDGIPSSRREFHPRMERMESGVHSERFASRFTEARSRNVDGITGKVRTGN